MTDLERELVEMVERLTRVLATIIDDEYGHPNDHSPSDKDEDVVAARELLARVRLDK